jgi:hypothetical protein
MGGCAFLDSGWLVKDTGMTSFILIPIETAVLESV